MLSPDKITEIFFIADRSLKIKEYPFAYLMY
jgi:hypothetical protein